MIDARKLAIQTAANVLREAQLAAVGTTSLDPTNEGIKGRFELESLLSEVRDLRHQQEKT